MAVIPLRPNRVEGTAIIAEKFGSVQGEGPWIGKRVQVETNGTQPPDPALVDLVDLWVVSPKLPTPA